MMERNVLTKKNVPVTTQSGKTGVSVTSAHRITGFGT